MAEEGKFEVYEKAPIVVAIIQFRYQKIESFDNKKIRSLGEAIKKEYSKISDSVLQNFRYDPKGETKVSLDTQEINGVRFATENDSKILVIGNEKFTFETHGKYSGWEVFIEEAKKLWCLFSPSLENLQLSGISMRYINRIDFPIETKDIKKYLTTFIESSTGDHQISQFQIRYTSVEGEIITHVGHAIESGIDNAIPYFLDIDVILLNNLINDDSVWEGFEKLREKKNYIFNDILTEEAKNLIR